MEIYLAQPRRRASSIHSAQQLSSETSLVNDGADLQRFGHSRTVGVERPRLGVQAYASLFDKTLVFRLEEDEAGTPIPKPRRHVLNDDDSTGNR